MNPTYFCFCNAELVCIGMNDYNNDISYDVFWCPECGSVYNITSKGQPDKPNLIPNKTKILTKIEKVQEIIKEN